MEVKILENKPNKLIFEVKGGSHTLCNALKMELWNDPDIKAAGYNVSHPLIGVPKFIVETKKSADVKKAVSNALKKLAKNASELSKKAATALK